ncbi:MAG: sigma-54 factor interaction domain-containing protein, partial [Bacteroidota bacterium]
PGRSLAAIELRAQIARAARAGGATLVEGESGTGKEFVASEVHRLSRVQGPYVVANCATFSSSLADSQLFGHERGAFTGAVSSHKGYFRSADGGTLFLDEIGELPLELQPKLLRAVELGEVVPLGGTNAARVQTRILAATNRTLRDEVEAGRFRRDLYARLSLQRIDVPPLRERRGDFLLWYDLMHQRWQNTHCSTTIQPATFSAEALEAL